MHCSPISSFILSSFCSPQDHHSFPTRRSSDLIGSQLKQFARMKPLRLPPARLGLADIAILCLLGGVIAVVVSFAREFEAPFSQAVRIDLSPAALPWYKIGRAHV